VGAFIVTRFNKLNFLNLLDLAAMSFLIGQGIGRWGNFTNQEAFGTNTELPWGMWSEQTAQYIAYNRGMFAERGITAVAGDMLHKAYVHPTFLYESLWCLLSFGVLYLICRKWRKFNGQLILCYGILYGAERFLVEGMRLDSLYIGSSTIRVSQLLSGLLVVGCSFALAFLLIRMKRNPVEVTGDRAQEAGEEAPAGEELPAFAEPEGLPAEESISPEFAALPPDAGTTETEDDPNEPDS